MPVILFLSTLLYTFTRELGIFHVIAMLPIYAVLITVFVCVMKMSYKAYKKGASPLIFAYGSYGVYPIVYGVGSIAPCIPSFFWIAFFMDRVQHPRFTILDCDYVVCTIALAIYCWFFYKKLARAFDKDEAFAKKLFFAYPLALKELAFGDSEYVLKCRCEPTPKYIPKEERVNTTVNEDVDED